MMISFVILNHNNRDCIGKCIDSVIKYCEDIEYEIIVIDNLSTDGSYEWLQSVYGNSIRLVKNTKNGCSSGRNIGIRYALGNLICFLDSDQVATNRNWLQQAETLLKENPHFGAVGWTGGWLKKDGAESAIYDDIANLYASDTTFYSTQITYLGTGGMLVKKEAALAAGGFDEAYEPAFFEDTDFSLRIRKAGYEIAVCSGIGIYHVPHQTTRLLDCPKLLSEKRAIFKEKWSGANQKYIKYTVDDPGRILVLNYYNPFNASGGQRPLALISECIRHGIEVTVVFESDSDMDNMRDFSLFFHSSLRLLLHDATTGEFKPINEQAEDILNEQDLLTTQRPDAVLAFVPVSELFDLFRKSHEAGILTIYDQMDKWDAFYGNVFGAAEADYVQMADYHTTITKVLITENLKRYGVPFLYYPNAVSESFASKTELSFDQIRERNAVSRKKVLYAGALWPEWFDWELLEYTIKNCPEYDFIIIGNDVAVPDECVECKSDSIIKKCHQFPNAVFTGALHHDRLPEYYRSANVAIIPFISNDITKPCSPLKYYEYVSAFLPVITTEIEDIKGAPLVRMAMEGKNLKERFVSLLKEATEYQMTELKYKQVQNYIYENRWNIRYELLRAIIFMSKS